MDNFVPLSKFKNVFTCFNIIFFYVYFTILLLQERGNNNILFYISVVIIGILFFHMIIVISCCGISYLYVYQFMNKINKDFERHSNNYGWTLTLIFLDILYLIYYIIIIFYYFMFGHDSLFKWKWDDFNCDFLIKKFKQNIKTCNILNSIKNFCINCFKKEGERERKINYESEYKCILCLTNPSQVIISPCGHKCLCLDCYNNQDTRRGLGERCPICRNNILSYVERVYYN